jgi:POT family proton-dependent oligopeptide transporter
MLLLAQSSTDIFYVGLSIFLVGNGLCTTCFNTILTQRFEQEDQRRESAFFFSYAAMNIGFSAGYIVSGFYDFSNQYQILFYIGAIVNLATLLITIHYWSSFRDASTVLIHLKNKSELIRRTVIGSTITFLLVPSLYLGFHSALASNALVAALSVLMFFVILYLGINQKQQRDKYRIFTYLILAVTSILFWTIYFTGPMGVTLFIKNNVDKKLFGIEIATQWILNINAFVIIIGAPLISIVIKKLQNKGIPISTSFQFSAAFILLSASFFLLSGGIIFSTNEGYSSILWIIGYFITQGMAELLIAPVGFAMIGRIAPAKSHGILMGTWLMISGVSASLSQYLSNAMVKSESSNPLLTNSDYFNVFKGLGICALLGAIFLYAISPKLKKFIETKNKNMPRETLVSIP